MSPRGYGAFDMAGNVFQWNEALIGGWGLEIRGGSFSNSSTEVFTSFYSSAAPPDYMDESIGFRVASVPTGWVPEPSSLMLATLGVAALLAWDWRSRSHQTV